MFRWRHQARIEREEENKRKKQELETECAKNKKQLQEIEEKIKTSAGDEEKMVQLQAQLKELELKKSKLDQCSEELSLSEKKAPWNVDTISKPAFSKTIINTKATKPSDDQLTEEEKEANLRDFVKSNEKLLKEYGMLRKYDDSKKFLLDHAHLASESTANYLVIWCINLEMEKKTELMAHVAHQCICMQVIMMIFTRFDCDIKILIFISVSVYLRIGQANGY